WRLFSESLSRPVMRPFLSIVTSPPLSLSIATFSESTALEGLRTGDEETLGLRSTSGFVWPCLLASREPDLLLRAITPTSTARAMSTIAATAYAGPVCKRCHQGALGL